MDTTEMEIESLAPVEIQNNEFGTSHDEPKEEKAVDVVIEQPQRCKFLSQLLVLILTNKKRNEACIHEEAREEDLLDAFGEYGEIKNIHLNLDRRTGFVKGYALLEFGTYKEARELVEKANDTKLLGQTIRTSFAFVSQDDEEEEASHNGHSYRDGSDGNRRRRERARGKGSFGRDNDRFSRSPARR
ncbi:RNA-binding protein 8A [Zancudomyces culisetae]|uniref:RNA-binding protein 8A n=1 Tax=Zancudomyces culisetae TaxID=1213189 RepID=A0A1R1PYJ4_ZANCU|nr:RNA-binding protein 8A [Zancudomyces culisetae]|eukprot:OMH86030.1 RNA-binding protein 8A [Zancudomyces culisetae]